MSTCNEASKKRADGHLRILILLSLAGFVWPGSAVAKLSEPPAHPMPSIN